MAGYRSRSAAVEEKRWQENKEDRQDVWPNRMLKKAAVFTRPTPARQSSPSPRQGRRE
jgi:hypothetical protein